METNVTYEIINPSDAYTMKAYDKLVAWMTCLLLGNGAYGLRNFDDEFDKGPPLFLSGGDPAAWLKETYGDANAWIESHRHELAACFRSVLIGDISRRIDYEAALEAIGDEKKRESFAAEYHDRHRSSMNDIGKRAMAFADKFSEARP